MSNNSVTYYREFHPEKDANAVLTLDLRKADKKEAKAFLGKPPKEALLLSIYDSEKVWVVIHEGKVEAVFGVCQGDDCGIPWFVSTDKFDEFKFTFVKRSKKILNNLLNKYEKLRNYVSVENKKSIKWLKCLNFKIHPDKLRFYDPDILFYKFTKTKDGES